MTLELHRLMTGPYNLNTYFLACHTTRQALVIDPGGPASLLVGKLSQKSLIPVGVLNTHGHADQFFDMRQFKQIHDIPYCLHEQDHHFFRDATVREGIRRSVGLPPPYPADQYLAHGQRVWFGEASLTVRHTPGHTPGSVCFLCQGYLMTGDTLFVGEAGRTDLPGGDLNRLIASIRNQILPLCSDTVLLPGHHHTGSPVRSTLARELRNNIYITDFIREP